MYETAFIRRAWHRGMNIVVRTYEPVTDEWKNIKTFLGKLRHFKKQPFHYKIIDKYKDKFNIDVPEDAFFMALHDVPKVSGWQVGAVIFASVLWLVMFYMFYFNTCKIYSSSFGRRLSFIHLMPCVVSLYSVRAGSGLKTSPLFVISFNRAGT